MTKVFYELMDPDTAVAGTHPAITLIDGQDDVVYHHAYFPASMASLSSVKLFVIPGAAGNMSWGVQTQWGRVCAGAWATEGVDSIAQHTEAVDALEIECLDITLAFTGILPGSISGVAFTRYGSAVSDTVNADCFYLGLEVEYV